jgi:hypothetical protein
MTGKRILPTQKELRKHAKQRVTKRLEERTDVLWHLVIYLFFNLVVFGLGEWLLDLIRGNPTRVPELIWITLAWGVGLVSHALDYYNEFGPGRKRRERLIQAEVEREMARLAAEGYVDKPKRDNLTGTGGNIRIGDDGELEIYFDDEGDSRRKRR